MSTVSFDSSDSDSSDASRMKKGIGFKKPQKGGKDDSSDSDSSSDSSSDSDPPSRKQRGAALKKKFEKKKPQKVVSNPSFKLTKSQKKLLRGNQKPEGYHLCIWTLYDAGHFYYGPFELNDAEYVLLLLEIRKYNNLARKIIKGTAPTCCYKTSEEKRGLWLARSKHADLFEKAKFSKPEKRWFYEVKPLKFGLLDDEDGDLQKFFEDHTPSKLDKTELVDILTRPLDSDGIGSLGIGLMPFTERLLL